VTGGTTDLFEVEGGESPVFRQRRAEQPPILVEVASSTAEGGHIGSRGMNFTLVASDHVVIDSRSVAIDTRESGGEVDIILVMPSTIVRFIQISNRVAA
jgi:hypothetical protein